MSNADQNNSDSQDTDTGHSGNSPESPKCLDIALAHIDLSKGIQVREKINSQTIDSYAEAMSTESAKFPPIRLWLIGEQLVISRGFHRVEAARKAGQKTIKAQVFEGTYQQAVIDALGSNATHGLPRTPEDKRKAVLMALEHLDPEISNGTVAAYCRVSPTFVSKVKSTLHGGGFDTSKKIICKDGKLRSYPKRPKSSNECPTNVQAENQDSTTASTPHSGDQKDTSVEGMESHFEDQSKDGSKQRESALLQAWKRITSIIQAEVELLLPHERMELGCLLETFATDYCHRQGKISPFPAS